LNAYVNERFPIELQRAVKMYLARTMKKLQAAA
jgi:hypothetical protein